MLAAIQKITLQSIGGVTTSCCGDSLVHITQELHPLRSAREDNMKRA